LFAASKSNEPLFGNPQLFFQNNKMMKHPIKSMTGFSCRKSFQVLATDIKNAMKNFNGFSMIVLIGVSAIIRFMAE
jgi:hypothetical protein